MEEKNLNAVENVDVNVNENAAEEVAQVKETVSEQVETPKAEVKAEPQEEKVVEAEAKEPEKVEGEEAEKKFEEPEEDYSQMTMEKVVERMGSLLEEADITHIKNRVLALRTRFAVLQEELAKQEDVAESQEEQADGEVAEMPKEEKKEDEVVKTFQKLYATYKRRRQEHKEAEEAARLKNLAAKEAILDSLKELVERGEENMRKANDEFKELQEKWKSVGDVPREKINDLWGRYHHLMEQFFNKMKINRDLRELDMKRNLEEKVKLCEQAEELIVESSIEKAFKGVQDLRRRWKEYGPVPTEQNDTIWERFNTAIGKVEERRKEYYEQRKEEMANNLLAKQALIEKAEELTAKQLETTKGWNETSEELDNLLKMWKTIGPVPREVSDEIWTKFKSKIDAHYEQKKEHFGQLREEQNTNYNKRIDLCVKAEAIAQRDDWKKATDELLQLQKEWKEIGPVSRKVSEKVWKRFRAACDEFFARKTEHYNELHGSEQENLKKKEEIIEQLKAFEFGENKEENLKVIKDFQRQWMEIGYVPMGEKERLQKEFRGVIDAHFEKLKISAIEAEENNYRSRLSNVGGDVKRFINSERDELTTKIEKLKGDIALWENNLGFLSNSRQAELLKEEFEKKMQHTRQQIALLEAKLKILKESEKEAEKDKK